MTEPLPIDLRDGKRHALKFTARGLRAMSIAHNYRSLRDMAVLLGEDVGISAFLYAGLLWQEPTMTIDDACDLVDNFRSNGGELVELARAVGEGLARSGHIPPLRPNGAIPNEQPRPAETPTADKPSTS